MTTIHFITLQIHNNDTVYEEKHVDIILIKSSAAIINSSSSFSGILLFAAGQ